VSIKPIGLFFFVLEFRYLHIRVRLPIHHAVTTRTDSPRNVQNTRREQRISHR
jgi:hypothetical protein